MKRYIFKATFLLIFTSLSVSLTAQGLRSAYFLEGSVFRHQMNPAFIGKTNYFSIPVLGNFNVGVQGNVGLNTFLYDYNDPLGENKRTTFLNESVGRNEFLNKIHNKNRLNANVNVTLLSAGFHNWGGFNTIELAARSNTSMNMPYELFDFMKSGMNSVEGDHYNIKNLQVNSNNYLDLSFGHARQINEQLTVGGKFKLLFGVANAKAHFEEMDITMSQDHWEIKSRGVLDVSMHKSDFETKEEPNEDGEYEIDGFDFQFPGLSGFGVGIDLGATYKMDEYVEGLTLSASVLDLGFISWGRTLRGSSPKSIFTFDGFTDISINKDDGSEDSNKPLEDQLDDLVDDLEAMFKFYDNGTVNSRTTGLAATINVGAEYVFPMYDKLTFGFLSSTRINKPYTWTEGRFYANVAPVKWFEASINYAASNFGSSFGWVLNFRPNGFNFFIGSDHTFAKINNWGIPIRGNGNINFGFNVTFGGPKKSVL